MSLTLVLGAWVALAAPGPLLTSNAHAAGQFRHELLEFTEQPAHITDMTDARFRWNEDPDLRYVCTLDGYSPVRPCSSGVVYRNLGKGATHLLHVYGCEAHVVECGPDALHRRWNEPGGCDLQSCVYSNAGFHILPNASRTLSGTGTPAAGIPGPPQPEQPKEDDGGLLSALGDLVSGIGDLF